MQQTTSITLGVCQFEVLTDGDRFLGLGKISIGDTLVRSGRLPIRPKTQSYTGVTMTGLRFAGIEQHEREARITVIGEFRQMDIKPMRDHSFDPIHETGDWDHEGIAGSGQFDIVLRLATDAFNGVEFHGFSYHYAYRSEDVPLFYILDMASWELDGDIEGATAVSQSSCSAPVAVFSAEKAWTTEGVMHWTKPGEVPNRTMTHNLPRWASHQSFDFQYKGEKTLIGVFDKVDLIRTLLQREAGKAELKCFDKHIFDQTLAVETTAKKMLVNVEAKTETDQKNIWSWIFDEVADRARAEYGLREEPVTPKLSINFWEHFTIDSYRRDLLPAAEALGIKQLFIDNVNKSAMTEGCPHPDNTFNMCCGHEYEPAPLLGGVNGIKRFVDDCHALGIEPFSWTNNDQSISSPLNHWYKPEYTDMYVIMEDCRTKYGGAYTNVFNIWSFNSSRARTMWVEALKKNREQTGLSGYLFDSFYNLGFMAIDYRDAKPRTMWRQLLTSFKELQDAGVHFMIESFGPFGQVQHGCPADYNIENIFACYKIGLGTGYTTIPGTQELKDVSAKDAQQLHYILAHMSDPAIPVFINNVRVDKVWGDCHKQTLADFYQQREFMQRRYLQEDGQAVLWHDAAGSQATLWNFADRAVVLPGSVSDVTTGQALPRTEYYQLAAGHTYVITGVAELPTRVERLQLAAK